MTESTCPVCASPQHQNFWYWEKEDTLMREWAMDTQVHFSICRNCGVVFQNPPIASQPQDSVFADLWSGAPGETPIADEPLDWIQQFGGRCKQPVRCLEVFDKQKRFEPLLREKGWDIRSVSLGQLAQMAADPAAPADPFAPDIPSLAEGETFDVIFLFDALEKTLRPLELLTTLHRHLKEDGALYVQTVNPYAEPRLNRFALTSKDLCVYPFRTLVFTLFKAGFANEGAEMSGRTRCVCFKAKPNPQSDPSQVIPRESWSETLYRFQRNFFWNWVSRYLNQYLTQGTPTEELFQKARQHLAQNHIQRHLIRDVCGAAFLFVHETAELETTLEKDWSQTLSRIFTALHNDYALYDLLQVGGLKTVSTFPDIGRFVYNDKMVYLTDADYFQRFFSLEEARDICRSVTEAGKVVCRNLSSFL